MSISIWDEASLNENKEKDWFSSLDWKLLLNFEAKYMIGNDMLSRDVENDVMTSLTKHHLIDQLADSNEPANINVT